MTTTNRNSADSLESAMAAVTETMVNEDRVVRAGIIEAAMHQVLSQRGRVEFGPEDVRRLDVAISAITSIGAGNAVGSPRKAPTMPLAVAG